jgi:hypothetical protein
MSVFEVSAFSAASSISDGPCSQRIHHRLTANIYLNITSHVVNTVANTMMQQCTWLSAQDEKCTRRRSVFAVLSLHHGAFVRRKNSPLKMQFCATAHDVFVSLDGRRHACPMTRFTLEHSFFQETWSTSLSAASCSDGGGPDVGPVCSAKGQSGLSREVVRCLAQDRVRQKSANVVAASQHFGQGSEEMIPPHVGHTRVVRSSVTKNG